jgi:post-segregation antitoxin (ccd killing protein)
LPLVQADWFGDLAMDDDQAPEKQAISLLIDSELIEAARRLDINVAEALEIRLRMLVKVEEERRWLEANREAAEVFNRRVAEDGVLSDEAGLP